LWAALAFLGGAGATNAPAPGRRDSEHLKRERAKKYPNLYCIV
jgi:hypothetical protein